MIFRRVTTGLDIAAALSRIPPGDPVDAGGVALLLRAMETGRLAGEAALIREKDC